MKSARGRGKSSSGNSGNSPANNRRKSSEARRARRITRMFDKNCRTPIRTLPKLKKTVNG